MELHWDDSDGICTHVAMGVNFSANLLKLLQHRYASVCCRWKLG
jgi:hypothetical protein